MFEDWITSLSLPELMKGARGKQIKNAADFEKRKSEIRTLLEEHEYGKLPPKPEHLRVDTNQISTRFCGGSATLEELTFTVTVGGREYSFPVLLGLPKREKPVPAFAFINFRPGAFDEYLPMEEIMDRGYAVFCVCYKDVTADDANFRSGIAPYFKTGRRKADATGKIMMWAWSLMRVMDYIETRPEIDKEKVVAVGHSRLGKTALVTAAFDERFAGAISNDSGNSGAALSRDVSAVRETVRKITDTFPYWFCPRYKKYADKEAELPFDQHFLTALIAPRFLAIGSAKEDVWADPPAEFLNAYITSDVYALYGKPGLLPEPEKIPDTGDSFNDGNIHYHIRSGVHYFSRRDWLEYLSFFDKKFSL